MTHNTDRSVLARLFGANVWSSKVWGYGAGALLATASVFACATGEVGEVGVDPGDETTAGSGTASAGTASAGTASGGTASAGTSTSTPAPPTGSTAGTTAGTTSGTTAGNDGGTTSGTTSGDGGTTSGDGGGTTTGGNASCAPPTVCSSARDIGTISGDTGSPTLTATGTKSEWLKMRITEDDSGIFSAVALKVKFRLETTPGTNFDLFVYRSTSNDVNELECTTSAASSTSATTFDETNTTWPDNQGFGGVDDAKNIVLEIRHVSGGCDAAKPWTVTVSGNAQ